MVNFKKNMWSNMVGGAGKAGVKTAPKKLPPLRSQLGLKSYYDKKR
jgi:hypothetical protein